MNRLVVSIEAPDFEIRVGTNDFDSFNIGIMPPLDHDMRLREEAYDFLNTRPIHRSIGIFIGADPESMYTDILLQLSGPEEKDIAVIGIAQAIINSGYTVKLNTKPVVYKNDRMCDLFSE